MTVTINDRLVWVAVVAFIFGIFTQMVFDYVSTPTIEETAQWKAEQEVEAKKQEIEMKMMVEAIKLYGAIKQ